MSKTMISERKIIDYETGQIKEEEITTKWRSEEPNYIKLYLEDLSYLYRLPKSTSGLLYELLNYTAYGTNEIILNISVKKRIEKKIKMSINVINNNITKLVKNGIIKRVSTGIFILNPYLFGKGDWKNLKELRNQNIEMKINYNSETGERTIESKLF